MRFERTLVVTTKDGEVFTTDIVADNSSVSVFRNGYSNWDGKRSVGGFRVYFTASDGEETSTFGSTRKEAIEEVAYRIAPYGKSRGLTYELVKKS